MSLARRLAISEGTYVAAIYFISNFALVGVLFMGAGRHYIKYIYIHYIYISYIYTIYTYVYVAAIYFISNFALVGVLFMGAGRHTHSTRKARIKYTHVSSSIKGRKMKARNPLCTFSCCVAFFSCQAW
jgi:hypothetical protein